MPIVTVTPLLLLSLSTAPLFCAPNTHVLRMRMQVPAHSLSALSSRLSTPPLSLFVSRTRCKLFFFFLRLFSRPSFLYIFLLFFYAEASPPSTDAEADMDTLFRSGSAAAGLVEAAATTTGAAVTTRLLAVAVTTLRCGATAGTACTACTAGCGGCAPVAAASAAAPSPSGRRASGT